MGIENPKIKTQAKDWIQMGHEIGNLGFSHHTHIDGIKATVLGYEAMIEHELIEVAPSYVLLFSILPVSIISEQVSLHTSNLLYKGQDNSSFKYEDEFEYYGKTYVNYILSWGPLSFNSITLVYSCNLFYLYQNNKQVK